MEQIFSFLKNSFKLYLFDEKAIEQIGSNISWKLALLVTYSLSILLSTVSLFFDIFVENTPVIQSLLVYIFTLGFVMLGYLVLSGLIYLLMVIFGGKASFSQTLKFWLSIMFVSSILILFYVIFVGLIVVFLQESVLIFAFLPLFILIGFLYLIWFIGVIINTFSKVHNVSLVRGFLALFVVPLSSLVLLSIVVSVLLLLTNPQLFSLVM